MKKTSKHHLNQVIKAGPSPVGDKKKKNHIPYDMLLKKGSSTENVVLFKIYVKIV